MFLSLLMPQDTTKRAIIVCVTYCEEVQVGARTESHKVRNAKSSGMVRPKKRRENERGEGGRVNDEAQSNGNLSEFIH